MRLSDGQLVNGSRPSYIASYDSDDLGYRDTAGLYINPVEWSIK